jgi:hypothetical protein
VSILTARVPLLRLPLWTLLVAAVIVLGLVGVWTRVIKIFPATTSGDLYYTRYQGQPNVKKIHFDYNGSRLELTSPQAVRQGEPVDGLVFAPDGDLLIALRGKILKLSPDGKRSQTVTSGTDSFHLAVDPDGKRLWVGGLPAVLAEVSLAPLRDGKARQLKGDNTTLTSLAFDTAGRAFYTSSDPRSPGDFGTINLTTFTTHRLHHNLAAAHGMTFDKYSGDLFLFGTNHVTQVDPDSGKIVSDKEFKSAAGSTPYRFDQGTADGRGHLFVAETDHSRMVFVDFSVTGKVGDTGDFVAQPALDTSLDDLAPLSGAGAPPKPGEYWIYVVMVVAVCLVLGAGFLAVRRRR